MQHLYKQSRRIALSTLLLTTSIAAVPVFAAVPAPSAPNMTDATDSGIWPNDNITKVAQPIFTGTGTALSTVTLYAGTTPVGYAIVGPSGQWTIAPNAKLKDGSYTMTVRQTVKGVQSAPSKGLFIVIDTVVPGAYTPSLAQESDSGSSDTDNQTNMTTLAFDGFGDPGTFVSVYNMSVPGGVFLGKATVSGLSHWQVNVAQAFPTGTYSYQVAVKASDMAGNTSTFSNPLTFGVDTDKPVAPNAPDLMYLSDSGVSNSDNITNVTLPTLSVKAEFGSYVELHDFVTKELVGSSLSNNLSSGGSTASATASIEVIVPLSADYKFYAVCTDRSGNQSLASNPIEFTVDTVKPTSTISTPGANAILSVFPSVTGVATDSHKIVQVKVTLQRTRAGVTSYWNGSDFVADDAAVDATLTRGSAIWHWDQQLPKARDLDAGLYTLTAYSTDVAGNVGTSANRSFTLSGRRSSSIAPSGGSS